MDDDEFSRERDFDVNEEISFYSFSKKVHSNSLTSLVKCSVKQTIRNS